MNNIEAWHRLMEEGKLEDLESLLDKQATFYSPLVFQPQVGRKLTALYLKTAYDMFFANGNQSFTYVREIHSDTDSMLEFTCEVEGTLINGVDIIKWNAEGKIIEFKVMVRPSKGIEKVREKMSALLANLSTFDKLKLKASMMADRLRK